jgi:hypothetical protein
MQPNSNFYRVVVYFNKEILMRLLNNDELKMVDGGAGNIQADTIRRRRNTMVDISFDPCANRDRIRYFWHNPIKCNRKRQLPPDFNNYWL